MTTIEKISKGKAHVRYKLASGQQVPGVTSILNVLAKPALIGWANRMGLQGIDTRSYVNALAEIGTLAHALIVEELGGPEVDRTLWSGEQLDRAENSVLSWMGWAAGKVIEPILLEAQMVSEEHHYGGTVDCLAVVDGVLTVIDHKTSSGIWPEHLHQLAAYWQLVREAGYEPTQARILQIGRDESEGFGERVMGPDQIGSHWHVFQFCLHLYNALKAAK